MKKCFYFPTWEEQKYIMISLDENYIDNYKIPYDKYIKQSTPSDPILAKLCELTGAKMYGDYVVLREKKCYAPNKELEAVFVKDGDILRLPSFNNLGQSQTIIVNTEYIIQPNKQLELYSEGTQYVRGRSYRGEKYNEYFYPKQEQHRLGNIFQEYSKFLRGEENKFEEVKKILNLDI
jgi:hypothetical protein